MKKYWESSDGEIYHGHVLEVLKQLPDESIQMCVTSPPYWGLRDYGNEPQIWDSEPPGRCEGGCDHVWGDETIKKQTPQRDHDSNGNFGDTRGQEDSRDGMSFNASQGQFCQNCKAWRGSLGLEPTPELFIKHMVQIFAEVKRVLRKDGTCWVNMGDSYAGQHVRYNGDEKKWQHGVSKSRQTEPALGSASGIKPKNLLGIPWRLAFALQEDGWYLRQDIIWSKPNPMPESVTDRCTKSHEYIFLLSKSAKYHYDADAIREPHTYPTKNKMAVYAENYREAVNGKYKDSKMGGGGTGFKGHSGCYKADGTPLNNPNGRNKRSVWTIATEPTPEAHFATFPKKLVEPCILAGCPEGGIVLDPFLGSGTTFLVSYKHGRKFIGIELSQEYLDDIAIPRIEQERKQRKLF
jgi:DNA modification methylase